MNTLNRNYSLILGIAAPAFILICAAIVGVAVILFGGNASVHELALQPVDLPPEFELAEENELRGEELIAQLPAESQVAEKGLTDAVHVTYQSRQGPLVDVRVYSYGDADGAKTAQRRARNDNPDALRRVNLSNGMAGSAVNDAQVVQGIGKDAFLMTGIASYDDGNQQTADQSFDVRIYFMRRGSARAELLVAGSSRFLDPDLVARNQYLRLGNPGAVSSR
jgi:hypothetical protein